MMDVSSFIDRHAHSADWKKSTLKPFRFLSTWFAFKHSMSFLTENNTITEQLINKQTKHVTEEHREVLRKQSNQSIFNQP